MKYLQFLICGLLVAAVSLPAADTAWLSAGFTGNGEDGLGLCRNEDGHKWCAPGEGWLPLSPAAGPQGKQMRDLQAWADV